MKDVMELLRAKEQELSKSESEQVDALRIALPLLSGGKMTLSLPKGTGDGKSREVTCGCAQPVATCSYAWRKSQQNIQSTHCVTVA